MLQAGLALLPRFVWLPNNRQPQHDLMPVSGRLQNSGLVI